MADVIGNRIEIYEYKNEREPDRRKYNVYVHKDLCVSMSDNKHWKRTRVPDRKTCTYEGFEDFSGTEYPLRGEGLEIRREPPGTTSLTFKIYAHPRLKEIFVNADGEMPWVEVKPEDDEEHKNTDLRQAHDHPDREWVIAYYATDEDYQVAQPNHRCK